MGEKTDSDEGSGTIMVVGVLAALAVLACSALAYIALLAAGNRAQNIAEWSHTELMSLRKCRHDRHGACEQWVGMECLPLGSSGS